MIQDGKEMFAIGLAHDGSPTAVNLRNAKSGPGRPLRVQFNGHSLAGATGFKLVDGATSSPSDDLATFVFSAAELNEGVTVTIPQTVNQYVNIELTGTTSGGTYTAGLAYQEGQTNK